jgi:hypothetical protein
MRIVEIKAQENGAHKNQELSFDLPVAAGWAVIPDDVICGNFPFGEVEATEVDGVMTVTKWLPLPMPTPEPETDTDADVWDAMAEAYNEGVQQA